MEDKRGARAEGIKDDIWQLNRTRTAMSTKEYNPMNDKKGNRVPKTHQDLTGTWWKSLQAAAKTSRVYETRKSAGSRLFKVAVNCYDYTASMAFKNKIRSCRRKQRYSENILSLCHFVHDKIQYGCT